MGGMQLGPLVFSAERAPVIVGFAILLLASWIAGRRTKRDLLSWAGSVITVAVVAARLGFVLTHIDEFTQNPLSAFAIWQGGFLWQGGVLGILAASLWHLRRNFQDVLPMSLALVLAAIGWNAAHGLSRGSDIPLPADMLLTRLDGSQAAVEDWDGTPTVINLWASWCPPCRREMPMMAEVAADETEVAIHFVNQGESADAIRRYLLDTGVPIDPLLDPSQQVMRHYGALGLPATLFIAADGSLISAHMGEISRAQLSQTIQRLKDNTQ